MTTVQVRMDKEIKEKMRKILAESGLTMSAAFNIFARNIIHGKKLSVPMLTENGFTPEQEAEMIRETEDAEKYGKPYYTVDEFMKDLLDDNADDYGEKYLNA